MTATIDTRILDHLQQANPNITPGQSVFIRNNLSLKNLILLKMELDHRKQDDLQLCIAFSDSHDVDDMTPAKVTWFGIDFYTIRINMNGVDGVDLVMGHV